MLDKEQYGTDRNDRANRDAAIAWKKNGGKVVGFVCDNVPTELIAASGALPYRIGGSGNTDFPKTKSLVRPNRIFSRGTVPEFVDSLFEALLDGSHDFLDLVIVPHNRKAVQRLVPDIRLAQTQDPSLVIPEMHFLDRSYLNGYAANDYNARQLDLLRAKLEELSGSAITDDALGSAVEQANTGRALLRRLSALRHGEQPRVSGAEALGYYRDYWQQDPATFNETLARRLDELSDAPALAGLPVFLAGSPFDQTDAYRAIEDNGAVVVGEDHCWGARCTELSVGAENPYEMLRRRYAGQATCATGFPACNTLTKTMARFDASGARAMIAAVAKGDTPRIWLTPDLIDAAREAGIPAIQLNGQRYDALDEAKIAEFIQSIGEGAMA